MSKSPRDPTPIPTGIERIQYNLPWPGKHMTPFGHLPATPAASGLWFFLMCAHRAVDRVMKQITVEGDDDAHLDLRELARGISIAAGVELSVMFDDELWKRAQAEVVASQLPLDARVVRFIESGGQTNRHFGRDPDAHTE